MLLMLGAKTHRFVQRNLVCYTDGSVANSKEKTLNFNGYIV